MRVILDCPERHLEQAFSLAQQFLVELPNHPQERHNYLSFANPWQKHSFSVYRSKTGVVVFFNAKKADRK